MTLRLLIAALPAAAGILAQMGDAPTGWLSFIAREGIAVGVLLIILFRIEPRLKALELSNDRSARAGFLLLVEHSANEVVREDAKQNLKDIDSKTPRA